MINFRKADRWVESSCLWCHQCDKKDNMFFCKKIGSNIIDIDENICDIWEPMKVEK